MIIGLCGYKQSGKDTLADYLVDTLGYTRASFVDKIKDSASSIFDPFGIKREHWDEWKNSDIFQITISGKNDEGNTWQQSFSVRKFLQNYGLAMREHFGEDFWIDALFNDLESSPGVIYGDYVNPSVRYENELERIRDYGGINIWINRDSTNSDGHASEQKPDQSLIDYELDNNSTLDNLFEGMDKILADLRKHAFSKVE